MALIGDTSELDTLLYGGKYMLPEAASYTMTTPWGVVSSDVSGGFVRQQLQFFNSPAQVQAVYRCVTKARVDFLKAFIRLHEGLPFIAALAVDTDTVESYVVDIVGAPTWQENGFSGTCTLTYQVQPTPNAEYDEFLQWSGAALGDNTLEFANWIAKTANIDLPKAKQMPIDATGTTSAFVSGLYYDNTTPVDFSDLITFSRLSAGSYIDANGVLKTAAISEPRFESGGLLIEQQSTNLLVNSSSMIAASGWAIRAGGASEITSETTSPDGTFNASKMYDNDVQLGSLHITRSVTIADNTVNTVSCYFKIPPSGTGLSHVRIEYYMKSSSTGADKQVVEYRLSDGNVQNQRTGNQVSAPPVSYGVKSVADGWFRLHISANSLSGPGTTSPRFMGIFSGSSTGDGSKKIYMAHPQVEQVSSPTSYISTSSSAVTRAADSASVDMQPHTAGTIFAEFLSDAVAIERVVYTAGTVTLKRLASGAISVTNGAVTVTSSVAPAGVIKAAISYDGTTLKLAVNGVVYSAASALPSAGVSIALGNTTFANVWQRSEAYDNARLVEVTQ